METCSICLDTIKNDSIKLNCNHLLHKKCYLKLLFSSINIFLKCPICRVNDGLYLKPYDSPKKNIEYFCTLPKRCLCKNMNGKRCKNKPILLNYGMCYQHNKNILNQELFSLMEQFFYFILTQRNSTKSRLFLLDLGKKLIIKYCNSNSKLDDLIYYFHKYISINQLVSINDYEKIYSNYEIEPPISDWLNDCINNYIFY